MELPSVLGIFMIALPSLLVNHLCKVFCAKMIYTEIKQSVISNRQSFKY